MLRKTFAAVACLGAMSSANAQTTLPQAPPPVIQPSTDQLIDFFLATYSEWDIERSYRRTISRLQGLRNVYRFDGPQSLVPRTNHRVSGANPPCGDPNRTVSNDIKEIQDALGWLGAGADALVGSPGFISVVTAGIAAWLGGNQAYQTNANCKSVCAALPGHLEEDQVKRSATLTFYFQNHTGAPFVQRSTGGWDNWSRLDEDVMVSKMQLRAKLPPGSPIRSRPGADDAAECTFTLVCTSLRNWSDAYDRSAYLSVVMDHIPEVANACVDYSLLNRAQYGSELARDLPEDIIVRYSDATRRATHPASARQPR